jgi:integrase
MLANERRVSVSTHNQALSALLFLYRDVLGIDLPWLAEVQRPTRPRRIPSVLTKAEVAALLGAMEGETALLGKLLYGTGMRLMEGLRLRVKDVDFDRQVLVVRQAKGGKDRVVMLPSGVQRRHHTRRIFGSSRHCQVSTSRALIATITIATSACPICARATFHTKPGTTHSQYPGASIPHAV